jgi:hypothetical protein
VDAAPGRQSTPFYEVDASAQYFRCGSCALAGPAQSRECDCSFVRERPGGKPAGQLLHPFPPPKTHAHLFPRLRRDDETRARCNVRAPSDRRRHVRVPGVCQSVPQRQPGAVPWSALRWPAVHVGRLLHLCRYRKMLWGHRYVPTLFLYDVRRRLRRLGGM